MKQGVAVAQAHRCIIYVHFHHKGYAKRGYAVISQLKDGACASLSAHHTSYATRAPANT